MPFPSQQEVPIPWISFSIIAKILNRIRTKKDPPDIGGSYYEKERFPIWISSGRNKQFRH